MELVVLGLNRVDALDLRRSQESVGDARLEEADIDPTSAGVLDPVSLVVFALGFASIQALVVWLMKNRHEEVIQQQVEIRRPDGTVERQVITVRRRDSTVAAETAEVLGSLKLPSLGP